MSDGSLEKDEFILDLISKRNEVEFQRSNILDSKASGIIGFAGIIIGLIGTLISFLLDKLTTITPLFQYYQSFRTLLFLGIVALVGSIFFAVLAYSIKTYLIVPKTSVLIEKYAKNTEKSKSDIIQVVGLEISDAIKTNAIIDDEKARFLKYALSLFTLGMFLIVIFVCGLLML